MDTKPYHHGDLRNSLIEAGIYIINTQGQASLSLRRVAAACGVSHTAPYSHFKDKEQLLEAMKEHISAQFAEALQAAADGAKPGEAVTDMGVAYVEFFMQKPHYYTFLFAQPDLCVNFNALDEADNYPPFEVFKQQALVALRDMGAPRQAYLPTVAHWWAVVHGMAAFASMPGIQYSGDWLALTRAVITNHRLEEKENRHEAANP